MKLSIIIRTWNRLEYTIRTIASIDEKCGLKKEEYEIICVDQGSKDGTVEWLKFNSKEGYYPLVPIFCKDNTGDGGGMRIGADAARGEFIAQHDNDLEIVTPEYYLALIEMYKSLEFKNKVCGVGGSHLQGINFDSAQIKFGEKRRNLNFRKESTFVYPVAWLTASFICRKKFADEYPKKLHCNSWLSYWWDKEYNNFLCRYLNFWHIDSDHKNGAHVQKQHDKFPSYTHVFTHYSPFIKEKS